MKKAAIVFNILEMIGFIILALIYIIAGTTANAELIKAISDATGVADLTKGVLIGVGVVYLVPLLWIVPMTIHIAKANKNGTKIGLVFKIIDLILVNLISGILLLCDNSDN